MYYDYGFGSWKLALSLAMMINISMLVGLTQRDSMFELFSDLRTIRKAAVEIKKHEPDAIRWHNELANVDKIATEAAGQ
ncbi:MAG: hypothetical protein EYC62_09405 [Alphaproteobacteria bacterium]|nr:MAG: hypothetical protein EYC62_09405 [Alphaproteobacteria bacterium]